MRLKLPETKITKQSASITFINNKSNVGITADNPHPHYTPHIQLLVLALCLNSPKVISLWFQWTEVCPPPPPHFEMAK